MKSSVATAVLGTAIFSQLSLAATIGHHHAHLHHKHAARAAEPAAEPGLKNNGIAMLNEADQSLITGLGMLAGKNVVGSQATAPITLGGNGGSYVVEFNNNSGEDIVVVVWQDNSWVNVDQPAITRSLASNKTMHVSFDPSQNGGSISGAWSAVYPNTQMVNGQISNTWGEYTFAGQWTTTDVSREVNMNGNSMEISNFVSKEAAKSGGSAACVSSMTECVFVCTDPSATSCWQDYQIINCPVGQAGNTVDASGQNGGCAGMPNSGYVVVNLS